MNRSFGLALALSLTACARQSSNAPQFDFEAQPRAVLAETAKSSAGPQMFFTPSGHLYLLAGAKAGPRTALNVYVSKNGGDSFDERIKAAPPAANPMTMGEMSPVLLEDPAGPSMDLLYQGGDGRLYFSEAYLFARKFPPPVDLVKKRVPSENSFATMALAPDGALYVAWLDGRASDRNPPNTSSLYVMQSTDHGTSFHPAVKVDGGTCPCCRPALAFGSDGTLYVAWRKDFPGNYRDIVVASSKNGLVFSPPVRVSQDGWSLDGCPDSGPTLKVVGSRLYVAWYTQAGTNVPQVRSAYTDDMKSFSKPLVISRGVLDANHPKFVTDSARPLLVFQGRPSNAGTWAPVTAFVVALDGDAASEPLALPAGKGSIGDPIAVMRDARTLYVAATAEGDAGSQIVLNRGRAKSS